MWSDLPVGHAERDETHMKIWSLATLFARATKFAPLVFPGCMGNCCSRNLTHRPMKGPAMASGVNDKRLGHVLHAPITRPNTANRALRTGSYRTISSPAVYVRRRQGTVSAQRSTRTAN